MIGGGIACQAVILRQGQIAIFWLGLFMYVHGMRCPYCTPSAYETFKAIDFFALPILSIMGATQNLRAENCVFAVIKPIFQESLQAPFNFRASLTVAGDTVILGIECRNWAKNQSSAFQNDKVGK
jgi:hypothetical protein